MIKKYAKYCLFIIIVCTSSCKKDFLQLDLGTALPEDKVFTDPLLAARYADNAYNFMIDDYGRMGDIYKGTTGQLSDEATGGGGNLSVMWQGNYLNAGAPDVAPIYTRMYQGIRVANTMLTKIEEVPWAGSVYNPKLISAQMLFLRAMFYYELIRRFGGVILLSTPIDIAKDEVDLPRNTYEETLGFILKDLQEAETILTTEISVNYTPATDWDAGNYGRPTIGAVKALKARVLMLDASPVHNPSGDAGKWRVAAKASKDIIDMGKYQLQTDYTTLLNVNSSPEYIMIKVRGPRQQGGFLDDFIMSKPSGGAQGLLNPTQNHVDLYEAVKRSTPTGPIISSAPINAPGSGYTLQNPYANRDPRFYANIVYHGQTFTGRVINMVDGETNTDYLSSAVTYTRTRYYCKKLWPEIYKTNNTGKALINYIFFRYGEVLMNYAEALNEADGPVADVYSYVNQVRARVGMPGLPANLTKQEMRTRIQNERGVEFAFEDIRYWDVLRWKKGQELISQTITAMDVVRNAAAPTGFTYTVVPVEGAYQRAPFQDRQYLYPIPLTEINRSKGILQQNPGW